MLLMRKWRPTKAKGELTSDRVKVGSNPRTAMHLACTCGHPEVVTLLAERKCLMNSCDDRNRTALMKAVQCQEEECATILLKPGADPDIKDADGNTALHYAALGQNVVMAAMLLLHRADMETTYRSTYCYVRLDKFMNSS
ncbi:inversin-like [Hipposideros larvatus]